MDNIVKFKRSSVTGKLPLPSQLAYGELAVNFSANNPFLSIKNNQDQIEKFLSEKGLMSLLTESYYDKQTINQMFEAFDPSGEIDFDNYYEKAEADAKFQTISGMSSYLTIAQAEQDYQPKGNYLTEHQSLENYYTKSEADGKFLTTHQNLSGYAQKSDLDDYLTIASASTIYATKEDLEEFTPTVDAYSKEETDALLACKANSAHTHDYETLTNKPDLSIFATKGEIPDTSSFATKQELEDYQMKSGMTSYLTIAQAEQDLQPKGDYALQSQIPDTSNFITSGFCEDRYQPKGTYVVPSDLNNYVTSGYAEETFAKKGDVPTDVYTKSETDTLLAGKASSSHTHDYSEILNTPDVPKIWKGTLSEYTNLTEIDNDTLYIITDSSEQLVTSGDVESMISGYTNLTEVQTLLEGYSTTSHTHSYNDLTDKPTIPSTTGLASEEWVSNNFSTTAHTHDYSEIENTPDLSGFASLSDIPDTSNFITSGFCEDHYQAKGTYVVPSDLDSYAEKSDLANYQPVSGMSDYVTDSELNTALEGYSTTAHTHSDLATKSDLDDYLTIASASTTYATKEDLEEFTPSDNYAGTVWTGTLSEYNNLTVIDSDTLYVITDANQQYVTSGDVESMISGFTNLTEVQTLLEGYSTTAHTHSQYLTETSADTRYARVVSLTQAQYDALVQNDQVEQGVLYCIIEQSNS